MQKFLRITSSEFISESLNQVNGYNLNKYFKHFFIYLNTSTIT